MSGVENIGHSHQSLHQQRSSSESVRRFNWRSRSAIIASAVLTVLPAVAKANVPLFSTANDFAIDTGDGNGWTVQSGSAVAPSTTVDLDGLTTNGVGNTTAANGTGTAGSFQVTPSGNISYSTLAQAPNNDQSNQGFFSAFDPGSIAAYTAGSSYGAGTTTAYSGSLIYSYTVPTGTTGNYIQAGIVVNGLPGGYQRFFSNSTISDGIVNGQPTYTATIPYTITAGSFGYFQFGLVFNTDYSFSGPLYIDGIQAVTASAAGQAEWITNGNGSWTTDANWNPGAPLTTGSSALFDTYGGTITTNPTVTLTAPVTIDSLTFNDAANSYTINGSTGSITTLAINVTAGSHTINTNLVSKDLETFTINSGASLTVTDATDGVGYYHNVAVVGGGTLSINDVSNEALDISGGSIVNVLPGAGSGGLYAKTHSGSTWNIGSAVTVRQFYADYGTFLNISPTGSFLTEDGTTSIDSNISGSGSLIFGGGALAVSGSTGPGTPQITGNNVAYTGAITITGGVSLQLGSQYFASSDAQLGSGSATNTVTLNNGTLTSANGFTGTHAFIIGSGGGTFATSDTINSVTTVSTFGIGSISGPGTLNVTGGGNLTVAAQVLAANASGGIRTLSLGGLNLANSSNASFGTATSQSNRTVLVIGSGGFSLSGSTSAWTSTVDLGGNDLIVQGGSLATITNQLKEGYAGGTWQGSGGILSTAAAADTTHLTTLGAIQNSTNGTSGGTVLHSTFDTASSTSSDVLVKYTYYGDANLDGKVDGADYSLIDNGYLTHATGWFNGDFNYDGVVDGSDYTLIDNAFNQQGAHLSDVLAGPAAVATAQIAGSGTTSAVPEPASIALLGIGTAGLLSRRRTRLRFR